MFSNVIRAVEFCAYHIIIVATSYITKIPVHESAKHKDMLMRRYMAAMTEVRILKGELVRIKGKNNANKAPLKLRCAQVLAYLFTRGDRTYHLSYMSCARATARNWAFIFRHPIRSRFRKKKIGRPKVTEEIIELILTMKRDNPHWGAKHIRGELRKMGIKLGRTTIADILKAHGFDPTGDRASKWEQWKGEFKDHMWSMDFFFVNTIKNIPCMVFLLVDTYTREILAIRVYEGRLGIDSYWVAGTIANVFFKLKRRPQNLVHDNDALFKDQVMRMCSVADIKELRVPPQYPVMNCYVERVIQSIKYELTHHIKARDGKELQKYLDEYKYWYNKYRPHQGIDGLTPSNFAEDKTHPKVIPFAELKNKRLKRISFADGLLTAYELVDIDLKKAA